MRLVLRPECRGLLVEALDGGRLGLRRQAGEIRIGGSAVRRFGGAGGQRSQPLVVGPVRNGDSHPPVADDLQLDDVVLDQRRLMHLRAGEAGQPGPLAVRQSERLVAFGRAERALGKVEGVGHKPTIWRTAHRPVVSDGRAGRARAA